MRYYWSRNRDQDIQIILSRLNHMERLIMATLADIQAAVAAEQTVDASVITLLGQLHDQLAAALASNDPAAMQAIVDSLKTEQANLTAAVTANTPTAPSTPPAA